MRGTYYVVASIAEQDNYYAAESEAAELTITKAVYDMSGVSFTGVSYTYDGIEKKIEISGTLPSGVTVNYTNNTLTNAGSTTATATFSGDTDNYEAIASMTAVLTITKAAGEGSVGITGWSYGEYDANSNSPAPASSTNGTDNVTYLYKVQGAVDSTYTDEIPTDAGSYTVQATFAATNNYKAVTVSEDFIISQRAITVAIDSQSSTYGNEIEALTAAVTEGSIVEGDTDVYSLSTSAASTSAVGTYDISGTALNGNYNITFVNEEGAYTITAAELTDVTISQSGTLTYDGTAQTADVTASAETADGTDIIYTYSASEDGEYSTEVPAFTDAGTYTVYYRAAAENHETLEGSFTVTIGKAVYDMSSVSFEDTTFEYDGEEKTLVIGGDLPDGVTVTYSDNTRTEAGSTTATAYFAGDADNYEAIDSMTATLMVAVLVELPEQAFPDEDAEHKIELTEGLTEVPEALQSIPELDTVEEIETELKTLVIEQIGLYRRKYHNLRCNTGNQF